MKEIKTVRLGGVPEHFNFPIHQSMEDGSFEQRGVKLEWTNYGGGTGQMVAALRNGEVDACVLLTEGIIKDIIAGNNCKIISAYVNTPLIWGIHTGVNNDLRHHSDIYNKRYAISRFGSGSHLMAIVDATLNDKKINKDQFTLVKDIKGALPSLTALETDVFYWEKYTTKPYVYEGTLRRVGEFVTPWPCFMIAATNDILEREPETIIRMLRTIHDSCDKFMQSDDSIGLVAERYNQKVRDIERWYHATEWSIHGWVSDKLLRSVVKNLKIAEIIEEDVVVPELVWKR